MNWLIHNEHHGEISDGLTTAQLPAAITYTIGITVVNKGKFQLPMTHTVPSGSYSVDACAGPSMIGMSTCSGFIHSFRLSIAY